MPASQNALKPNSSKNKGEERTTKLNASPKYPQIIQPTIHLYHQSHPAHSTIQKKQPKRITSNLSQLFLVKTHTKKVRKTLPSLSKKTFPLPPPKNKLFFTSSPKRWSSRHLRRNDLQSEWRAAEWRNPGRAAARTPGALPNGRTGAVVPKRSFVQPLGERGGRIFRKVGYGVKVGSLFGEESERKVYGKSWCFHGFLW